MVGKPFPLRPVRAGRIVRVAALLFLLMLLAPPGASSEHLSGLPGLSNVGRVANGIFRGAQPEPEGYATLKAMGIRTVINLRTLHGEREAVEAAGMGYVEIPMSFWGEVDPAVVRKALAAMTEPANQPVFVHCSLGADRTGVVVAVYRMEVDGWSEAEAEAEMEAFGFHEIWSQLKEFVRRYPGSPEEVREEDPAGQPPVPQTVTPANGATPVDNGYIDRSHEYIEREMNAVVNWFDDFFVHDTAGHDNVAGHVTVKEKIKRATIKLKWTNDVRAEKGESVKFRSSVNAHVRLPNLEKKFRLVIMEETSPDTVVPIPIDPGTPAANTPTQTNSFRTTSTELRYYAHETKTGYAFLAAGSRFTWLPETYVRTRFLTRRALVDNTFISPSATVFWQDHLGFGVTPQLEFGHPFAHQYIFVWANSATVYRNRSGFLWGTEVSLSKILSPVTAVALAVGASGATRPSAVSDRYNMGANNYKISFKYRRRIYRPWLFVELVPETNWQRNDSGGRDFIPAITVRLEINSEGHRALLPVPLIVEEPLPLPLPIPKPE